MDKISIDFIIFATFVLTIYQGAKRGFFRESLIAIAYVPYIAALFYIINEWIQGSYSFDSILYKCSALGGTYLAYLLVIWTVAKSLKWRLESIDETFIYMGKAIAGIICGVRTVYFCFLCLIAFNLHLGQLNLTDKSKLATAAMPMALKAQDYLLNNGYIDNEITIYEDAFNGTVDKYGKYEHPLMTKLKNSDRYKSIEEKIDKKKIQKQMDSYLESYGGGF